MPVGSDDDQTLETGDETETEVDEAEETEETEETEESSGEAATGTEKRVRDLQSKADAAEARANKAEQALAAKARGESGAGVDPGTKALMAELREASLDAVYAEFSHLRDYGIDRSLIEGSTRVELRDNASALVSLIKGVESKVRNRVLSENGLKADPAGTRVSKPVDYNSMKDEDFIKLLDSI